MLIQDDIYDDFLGMGAKAKEKQLCRAKLEAQGISRKQAKKQCLLEVGRSEVGYGLSRVGLFSMRNAFIILLRLNFRGLGFKLGNTKDNPTYSKEWLKIKQVWRNFGGKTPALVRAIDKGKGKRPLMCARKCKETISNLKAEYSNIEPTTTTAAVIGAKIVEATPIIKAVGLVVTMVGTANEVVKTTQTQNKLMEVAELTADRDFEIENQKLEETQKVTKFALIGGGLVLVTIIGLIIYKQTK